jgi:hypothetical protein
VGCIEMGFSTNGNFHDFLYLEGKVTCFESFRI